MEEQESRQPNGNFRPSRFVRHPFVQSSLAMYPPRRYERIREIESPVVLDAGPDETGHGRSGRVRLLGYYTPEQGWEPPKGLVLCLHGWEGCSHTTYNLELTDVLLGAGYSVFRLNLRDHGPGLHLDPLALNAGVFLATLLDEVAAAVHQVAEMAGDAPFYVVGPSMGGNFALRLAVRHRSEPFHNLEKVIAVNPAINPARSTNLIDRSPIFLKFFRRRWLGSLLTKQELFPGLYDFSPVREMVTLREMTDWLVKQYSPYSDADSYFGRYAVLGGTTKELDVPTTIITSGDDQIVALDDFYELAPSPYLSIQVHEYGGHMGYIDIMPFRHCLASMVLGILSGS